MENYIILALAAINVILVVVVIAALVLMKKKNGAMDMAPVNDKMEQLRQDMTQAMRDSRMENNQNIQLSVKNLGDVLAKSHEGLQNAVNAMAKNNEDKLEKIREMVHSRLTEMQNANDKQLEKMRATVDEKLQKTLEERIGQSFKLVSERLEQVYKGLGEMQTLAEGVGDIKKVLSNVKTRGVLGEIQLGALLEQILSPEQYATNVMTKKGSQQNVEYAVKMPGQNDQPVYLPIDAKFPADAYAQLVDAYDSGNIEAIDAAGKVLETRIKSFAKDIRDKYLDPPATTDFGMMFLPFEGLYAEVVRRGLVDVLQRDYKVVIAGPTTMAALLNSLQMGFRTLALQKRSSEVWDVLGAVKTEFDKFGQVVEAAQRKLEQANNELDQLVGVRTRQIQRKLRNVTALPETEATALLADTDDEG